MYILKNEVNGMLLQFKFSNFRSFAEEVIFDMRATNIKEHKYSLIEINGVNILPVAAVYGANASGKSSFFMAIKRMRSVIVDRFVAQRSQNKNMIQSFSVPFMFDEDIKKEPTSYEVVLLIGDYNYRYGFKCTKDEIISEYLYKQKLSKNQTIENLIFKRDHNNFTVGSVNKDMKKEIEYCESMATDKILILSDIGLRKKERELCGVFAWFLSVHMLSSDSQELISSEGFCEELLGEFLFGKKRPNEAVIKETYKEFIREIDPSISDIVPSTMINSDGTEITIAKVRHTVKRINYDVPLTLESDGTKKVMGLALIILAALNNKSPIFIDELDSKLHPLLLRRIIQMFTNNKTNPNTDNNSHRAQLIFSAHNVINLDSSDLRRDEIWFVEKDNHMSTMYSLYDFEDDDGAVRSDLSYGKHYLSGRFGAVPFQEEE